MKKQIGIWMLATQTLTLQLQSNLVVHHSMSMFVILAESYKLVQILIY